MTNKEINKKVAALCGWRPTTVGDLCWDSNGNAIIIYPNYAGSLDMCREFEGLIKKSTEYDMRDYIINLEDASKARGSGWDWRSFQLTTATPLERCEAFLRLKGQWDEN